MWCGREVMVALLASVLATTAIAQSTTAPPASTEPSLRCLQPVPGITWQRWMGGDDATLNQWCDSVGKPVLMPKVYFEPAEIAQLTILSWNVNVGGGRAEEFIPQLQRELSAKSGGLVVLLQETFRTGWDVPESVPPTLQAPGAVRPRRPAADIVALATALEMSVAYVPSMRNGSNSNLSQREDRGNAILSSEPLSDVTAIELPFGRQRRVAIAATVTPRGSRGKPLRVMVLHFDTDDHRAAQAQALAMDVKAFTETKSMPLVVAGDLNARDGLKDEAVAAMSAQIHREECGTDRTFRLPFRVDKLSVGRLDYMFSTLDDFGLMRTCQTLDDPIGSDHVPVVMTITF